MTGPQRAAFEQQRDHRKVPGGEQSETVRVRVLGCFMVAVETRTIREGEWHLKKARSLIKLLALAPGHRLHREQAM